MNEMERATELRQTGHYLAGQYTDGSYAQATCSTPTREEWDEISRRLREPFDPRDVDFRAQGRASEQSGKAQVVAYIDARVVQDRLDAVVGPGNWSFDWTPLVVEKGEVMVAKGTLTLFGVAKSDAGSASNFEQTLGAVSHALKRAAVHWGVGRYLYNLPSVWVAVEKNGRIPDAVLRELRAKLPRPAQTQAAPAVALATADGAQAARRGAAATEHTEHTEHDEAPETRPTPLPAAQPVAQATARLQPRPQPDAAPAATSVGAQGATERQIASIRKLCEALGRPAPEGDLSYTQARELISQLSGEYQRARKAS